jgi:hypothetical protein
MIRFSELLHRVLSILNTCTGSTSAIGSNLFQRNVVRERGTGVYLATVTITVPTGTSSVATTEYRRTTSALDVTVQVKNEAGTVQTERVYPESIRLETTSHASTHTATSATIRGVSSFYTLYKTAIPMRCWFVVMMRPEDRLVTFVDSIPDTNCAVTLLKIGSGWMEPGKAEI